MMWRHLLGMIKTFPFYISYYSSFKLALEQHSVQAATEDERQEFVIPFFSFFVTVPLGWDCSASCRNEFMHSMRAVCCSPHFSSHNEGEEESSGPFSCEVLEEEKTYRAFSWRVSSIAKLGIAIKNKKQKVRFLGTYNNIRSLKIAITPCLAAK